MRGRGMTEQQRLVWLLSTPVCAETNRAMQELTGVQYNSGEQNKDMTEARQKRDMKDTLVILTTLADRNPFAPDPNLRSIMTGVNADSTVNVDQARVTGDKVLSSMTGKSAADYTFKRSAQAVTLASKSSVKIEREPQLMVFMEKAGLRNTKERHSTEHHLIFFPNSPSPQHEH